MITIHSAMLVLLGFFVAALAGFLFAPMYRRRAARLATDELKRAMPLTIAEIKADKDRLRAEFAITIHKLESKIEQAGLSSARQLVEINRRDAAISALEGEVARMRTFLDEHENARRVLEQTITESLPKVEKRLAEAKKVLSQRDKEIFELSRTSNKNAVALEEALQINAQQRDEIHKLNATLTMHAARNRETVRDPRFETEVALRSEIEALRARTKDQSVLIGRLQGVLTKSGVSADRIPTAVHAGSGAGPNGAAGKPEEEIQRLTNDLAEAELALRSVKGAAEAGQAEQSQYEQEIRTLKAQARDQAVEIAKLQAALKSYEGAEDRGIKESKIALKARLSALQAQADEQTTTIHTLRGEIAAANEKLARQAAHYMDEMRRLGAGSMPATGPARRGKYEPKRPSLAERIAAPRPLREEEPSLQAAAASATASSAAAAAALAAATVASDEAPRQSGFLRALESTSAPSAASEAASFSTDAAANDAAAPDDDRKSRRPGLLERITGLDKPA